MSKEKISKQQLDSIMKSNPDLAKRIVSGDAIKDSSSNPTYIFTKFSEAKQLLGFLDFRQLTDPEPTTDEERESHVYHINIAECFDFGSAVISDKENEELFAGLVGKRNISIGFTDSINSLSTLVDLKRQDAGKYDITYDKEIVPIRFCFVLRNGMKFKTIGHVDRDSMCRVGKYLVYKNEVVIDKNKDGTQSFVIYIKCNPEKGTVSFHADIGDNDIYVIPLVISKEFRDSTIESFKKTWEEKEQEFKDRLTSGYSDEDKAKICEYFKTSKVFESDHFSKASAIFALNNEKVYRIEDAIESNTKKVDVLNIVSALFPRFGEEYVDLEKEKIVFDENTGLPTLTEADVHNLKIVGLTSEMIKAIIGAASSTYSLAKSVLEGITEEKRKEITAESYDAECKMIVELDNDNWYEVLDEGYEAVYTLHDLNESEKSSKENIEDGIQGIASLQLTSRRIAAKVEGGEFKNMYMQLCNTYFKELYIKLLEINKEDFVNHTPFCQFFELVNARNKDNEDFITDKIRSCLDNTFHLNIDRNKHGIVPYNLFEAASDMAYDLFDKEAIPVNISEGEESKKIMDLMFTRLNYIDTLSRTPYKFIGRCFPEIFSIDPKQNNDIAKESADKYFAEMFNGSDLTGINEEQEYLKANLPALREKLSKYITYAEENNVFTNLLEELNKLANKFENTKCKTSIDKAKLFAKYFVYLNMYEYIDSLATGCGKTDTPIEEIEKIENYNEIYSVEMNGKRHPISEYKKIVEALGSNKERVNVVIIKNLTHDEKVNILLDLNLRAALLSEFIISSNYLSAKYVDFVEHAVKSTSNKTVKEYGKMFISQFSLFVPAISVLEESFENISDVIPSDIKVKLGTDAVADAVKDMDNKEKLTAARVTYAKESFKFVARAIKGVLSE